MQWINCAEKLPSDKIFNTPENIYIRNVETKYRVENGYFRSYAGKDEKWALKNFEWLDESEHSFSIEDMVKSFHEGADIAPIEVGDYANIFNKFLKREYNIDIN